MKYFLVIFIAILTIWMFALLERDVGLIFYLQEPQRHLFVGLAILTGASLVALRLQSASNDSEVYRAYCKVSAELEKGPLTREELGGKIGSKHDNTVFESEGGLATTFSRHQSVILDHLIYEGKVVEREGKLSLPS